MTKNIWLMNHYATAMFFNNGGRHHWFAEQLLQRGYQPTIFCANTRHNSTQTIKIKKKRFILKFSKNIPYVFVKSTPYTANGISRIRNMLTFSINLRSIVSQYEKKAGKPDIILASSVHPFTLLVGQKISKTYGVPFICEIRDLWPETLVAMGKLRRNSLLAKLLYAVEKSIYKKADKIIFTIPGGKDYITSIGLKDDKVAYINNGVDLKQFNYNKRQYEYYNNDFSGKNKFKIIYTGSMGRANALITVIKAAEILQKYKINDIMFYLFGDGYQRKMLSQYVDDRKILNVKFMGTVEKKYIPYILSKSQLNVFTGQNIQLYQYGLSLNKLFEYLASGKPILSNIACGYDILKETKSGITIAADDPEAFADGILKFYHMSPFEFNEYCRNASLTAKEYDFEKHAEKLEKIILKLTQV